MNATVDRVLVNDRPRLDLDVPATAPAGDPVPLRAHVIDEIGDVEVTWRLPGGAAVSGLEVEHAFPEGNHTIRAAAEDTYGARAAAEATLRVEALEIVLPGRGVAGPGPASALAALAAAGLARLARRRC